MMTIKYMKNVDTLTLSSWHTICVLCLDEIFIFEFFFFFSIWFHMTKLINKKVEWIFIKNKLTHLLILKSTFEIDTYLKFNLNS